MATHLKILSQHDKIIFEFPPKFNGEDRKRFFALPKWTVELVDSFKTPTNKVGLVLQFGYFKVANKFFVTKKFVRKDVEFVARRLQCSVEEICLEKYSDAETEGQKQNIIQTIKNGSVVAWQHINLQGEYDFSEEILRDSIEFKLPELLAEVCGVVKKGGSRQKHRNNFGRSRSFADAKAASLPKSH